MNVCFIEDLDAVPGEQVLTAELEEMLREKRGIFKKAVIGSDSGMRYGLNVIYYVIRSLFEVQRGLRDSWILRVQNLRKFENVEEVKGLRKYLLVQDLKV